MSTKRPYLGRSVIRRSTNDPRVLYRIKAAQHDPPLVMDDKPADMVFTRLLHQACHMRSLIGRGRLERSRLAEIDRREHRNMILLAAWCGQQDVDADEDE
jgi:hypothetical protein